MSKLVHNLCVYTFGFFAVLYDISAYGTLNKLFAVFNKIIFAVLLKNIEFSVAYEGRRRSIKDKKA